MAAEQGDADAQSRLGLLYANGQGAPEDFVQAHLWLSLAAAQGDKSAAKERDLLVKKMTPRPTRPSSKTRSRMEAQAINGEMEADYRGGVSSGFTLLMKPSISLRTSSRSAGVKVSQSRLSGSSTRRMAS